MDDKYELLKLKNQLCFPLYLCSKEIIRRYTPYLKEIDLTYTQYVVMMYFWEEGSSNLKDLGRTLILDSSTLTPLINKLVKKGFLEKIKQTRDERYVMISLTEKGKELQDKALDIPEKLKDCISITEEEQKQLYTVLYKILFSMEKENDNGNA